MKLLDYINGLRKGRDAYHIERAAMNDPFLAEALEGYDFVRGDHITRIEEMQKIVSGRTNRKNNKIWFSVAGVAAVALVILYVTVLNKPVSTSVGDDALYVYVSENYIEQKKMEISATDTKSLAAVTEIENIDILLSEDELDVYIPEDYVIKRRSEGTEGEQVQSPQAEDGTVIINIEEIFTPETPMEIYVPEDYSKRKV